MRGREDTADVDLPDFRKNLLGIGKVTAPRLMKLLVGMIWR